MLKFVVFTYLVGSKEGLRSPKPLASYCYDLPVR